MSLRPVNILLLGGAKRVSMARLLIEAGRRRNIAVRIHSYELSRNVPIAAVATSVTAGRRWADPTIYQSIADVVRRHDISIILPFVDPAVGVASRFRERLCARGEEFDNVFVPVSAPAVCDVMFDKLLAAELFERVNLPIPPTYVKGRPVFPLIAKPTHGSASRGIKVVRTTADFRSVISPAGHYLLQEYVEHNEEYTVDCYITAEGHICAISPRLRLEVVGGEVSRTITVSSPRLESLTRATIERTGLRGAVTVQFLRCTDTDRLLLMEVNPRLGGGAVCSVHAGVDIPGMILDEAAGAIPAPATPRPGVEIVRYMDEVVFDHNDAIIP